MVYMFGTIPRKEAKRQGLAKYKTSRPCKFGHIAERYVANGACVECMRLKKDSYKPDPNIGARRYVVGSMATVKLRAFPEDLPVLKATAYAFAVLREPVLLMQDVYPNVLPADYQGGTYLYRFNVFDEDVPEMRRIANETLNATAKRNINIEAERQRIHGAAYVATAPKDDGWPADHWK